MRYLQFYFLHYESTRVDLQFHCHDKYLTLTLASISAIENVHISLTNTDETVLNCTECLSMVAQGICT